jgi:hypothetical protein
MAVARALQLLPPHQLEGLKKISYEERALVPGLQRWVRLPGKSRHRGRYDHEEQAIMLHRCDSREQLFHALFHELGHFVYFRVISSFEKKHWVMKVHPRERPVSHYGRHNAAEDFAEAFALYVQRPEHLAELRYKYSFLRDVVFRGRPVDQVALDRVIQGDAGADGAAPLDTRV